DRVQAGVEQDQHQRKQQQRGDGADPREDSKPLSLLSLSRMVGTGSSNRTPRRGAISTPARNQMMTAKMMPTIITRPMSAPTMAEAATGPGWGGAKMCIALKATADGRAVARNELPRRRATA